MARPSRRGAGWQRALRRAPPRVAVQRLPVGKRFVWPDELVGLLGHGADAEILAVWKRFLELDARSAEGYLERAGTYHLAGDAGPARADLKRACELGSSRACALLRWVGAE
jgi:hypothetical protein